MGDRIRTTGTKIREITELTRCVSQASGFGVGDNVVLPENLNLPYKVVSFKRDEKGKDTGQVLIERDGQKKEVHINKLINDDVSQKTLRAIQNK